MRAQEIYAALKELIVCFASSGTCKITGSLNDVIGLFEEDWADIVSVANTLGHSEGKIAKHLFLTAATSARNEGRIPRGYLVVWEDGDETTLNLGQHFELMSALG